MAAGAIFDLKIIAITLRRIEEFGSSSSSVNGDIAI